MFRRNKLFFWTAEILLLTIIFYLWRRDGVHHYSLCHSYQYDYDSILIGGIFLLPDKSNRNLLGEKM